MKHTHVHYAIIISNLMITENILSDHQVACSGNSERIVKQPHPRHNLLSDPINSSFSKKEGPFSHSRYKK